MLKALVGSFAAFFLSAASVSAQAQSQGDWPSKPITILMAPDRFHEEVPDANPERPDGKGLRVLSGQHQHGHGGMRALEIAHGAQLTAMGLLEIEAGHLGRKLLHNSTNPCTAGNFEIEVFLSNSTWNIAGGKVRGSYPQ